MVPEERRGGVARALMVALAAGMHAKGYKRIDLNVLDWNPARGFYEKVGFSWIRNWLPYRLSGEALDNLAYRIWRGLRASLMSARLRAIHDFLSPIIRPAFAGRGSSGARPTPPPAARRPAPATAPSAARREVDVHHDRLVGRGEIALLGVVHLVEEVHPLGVAVEQLGGEAHRRAALHLAVVGDVGLQHEGHAVLAVDVGRPSPMLRMKAPDAWSNAVT